MTLRHGSTFNVRAMLRAAIFVALFVAASLALASGLGARATGRIDFLRGWLGGVAAQNQTRVVTTVSAASFDASAPVAPESIAAIFGVDLARDTSIVSTLPLPTQLLGTSVGVRDSAGIERPAFLFFISPSQINCLIPAGTADGLATITVRSGKGNTETGTVLVSRAAPGILTANASGVGAPAAVAFRIKSNGSFGFEAILQGNYPNRVPAAIDLGPEGESVFLILYLCGLRFVPKADVRVLLGGIEVPSTDFEYSPSNDIGVDQLNVRLSRSLIGRGRLKLSVSAQGRVSNQIEFEVGGRIVSEAPQITAISKTADVLAGEEIVLTGARFAANAKDNTVRFGTRPATVVSASTGQLRVRVPYGAKSGPLTIVTPQGEGHSSEALAMRTTISGFVKDTHSAPIPGVKVTMGNNNRTVLTNSEGLFFLNEVPANTTVAFLQFDGRAVTGALFPDPPIKYDISSNGDNLIEAPVFLLQVNGAQTQIGSALTGSPETEKEITLTAAAPDQPGIGDLKFIVPAGTTIRFPGGATSGTLTLNAEPNGLTPVPLPPDNFVSVIAQIAFFGATLNPGGKLIFPNTENLPAGTQARLYRYDVATAEWVNTNDMVTITPNGIETSVNAVKQTSYYFIAAQRPVTTPIGRVIEDNGTLEGRPVAGATVRIRGRETTTDGNGGFVLRGVGVNSDGAIFADVNLLRANGQVDSKRTVPVQAVINGLTNLGAIILATDAVPNRPPTALIPASITVNAGEQFDQSFTASDPDPGQSVSLQISDTRLAEIISRGNGAYTLRLKPTLSDANSVFKLVLTVTDNLGKSQSFDIAVIVRDRLRARGDEVSTDEDIPVKFRLFGSDPDGKPLTYQIVSQPSHGQLSGNATALTYIPDTNYNGSDSFTFKVNNGVSDSNVATISITINPVNDAPVLTVPGMQTVTAGQPLSFTVTASDVDAGQTLTLSASNPPTSATFTQTSATSGQFNWTPSSVQAATYSVSFRVTDNGTPSLMDSKVVSVTVQSSPLRWRQTSGPTGGGIRSLLANGSSLFAATVSGVFVSTNNGQNWSINRVGLRPYNASTLAAIGSVIFAGTYSDGVMASTDNGQNWRIVSNGLTSQFVQALAVSGTTLFAGTIEGVFVSTNNGQNWTAINNGLTNLDVRALAVSGTSLFAGTLGGGVFASTNNGQSWTAVNNGLAAVAVNTLTVSGTSIFAGSYGSGVFVSTNNGQTWTALNNGLTGQIVNTIAVSGTRLFAGTLRSGIFVSTNNGQSWAAINNGLANLFVNTLIISGTSLFAGTDGSGIFISANDGQSWAAANDGMMDLIVRAFAVSDTSIFAGTLAPSGAFVSVTNGQSWTAINSGLSNPAINNGETCGVNALVASGTDLFAGTSGGVFVSTNNGQSWNAANNGIGRNSAASYVNALVISGARLFAGTGDDGVFVSSNNGQSWTQVNNGLNKLDVRALAVSGTSVFVGTLGGGVFLSTNNGQSWIAVNNGLTNIDVRALAVSGANLFAGTYGGVFVSTNNGQSWTAVNNGLTNQDVLALTVSGTSLFTGTFGGEGVYVSTNNGQSWRAVGSGLTIPYVHSLLVSDTNLFAGTQEGGVFVLNLAGNP